MELSLDPHEIRAGDLFDAWDRPPISHFEPDPHPAGRDGWIVFEDGTRTAHSAGYPVAVVREIVTLEVDCHAHPFDGEDGYLDLIGIAETNDGSEAHDG